MIFFLPAFKWAVWLSFFESCICLPYINSYILFFCITFPLKYPSIYASPRKDEYQEILVLETLEKLPVLLFTTLLLTKYYGSNAEAPVLVLCSSFSFFKRSFFFFFFSSVKCQVICFCPRIRSSLFFTRCVLAPRRLGTKIIPEPYICHTPPGPSFLWFLK